MAVTQKTINTTANCSSYTTDSEPVSALPPYARKDKMPRSSFAPRVKIASAVPTKKVQKRMQQMKDQIEITVDQADSELKRGHSIGDKPTAAPTLPIF